MCFDLRDHNELYDFPRARVDKHDGVIAPEEVFYRATPFDHDDVRRQIVKHEASAARRRAAHQRTRHRPYQFKSGNSDWLNYTTKALNRCSKRPSTPPWVPAQERTGGAGPNQPAAPNGKPRNESGDLMFQTKGAQTAQVEAPFKVCEKPIQTPPRQ
jgi:hypothetical protein